MYITLSEPWTILFSLKMYRTSPHFRLSRRGAHSNSDSLVHIVTLNSQKISLKKRQLVVTHTMVFPRFYTARLRTRRLLKCCVQKKNASSYTDMRRIKTFRLTTNRIYELSHKIVIL
jgi:hypothetical protein